MVLIRFRNITEEQSNDVLEEVIPWKQMSACVHKSKGESFLLVKQWHAVNFFLLYFFLCLKNSCKFHVKNNSANVKTLK